MLEALLGSRNKERVLLYLAVRKEGYAREIASYYDVDLSPIQKQLDKLEAAGLLISLRKGKTLIFMFNPRYPFYLQIIQLLEKSMEFMPEEEKEKLKIYRKRPRRKGKPV